MKITGLKHQWGDQLLSRFGPDPESYDVYREHDFPIYNLLTYLETIDGPDLWVGSSHSLINFCARDARDQFDKVPSLAMIYASRDPGWYHLRYPLPPEFCPWFDLKKEKNFWANASVSVYTQGVAETADMLLTAIAAAETNPSRTRADWLWYICPHCNFHFLFYQSHCERCGTRLPTQINMQAKGLYRKAFTPEGTVIPHQSKA